MILILFGVQLFSATSTTTQSTCGVIIYSQQGHSMLNLQKVVATRSGLLLLNAIQLVRLFARLIGDSRPFWANPRTPGATLTLTLMRKQRDTMKFNLNQKTKIMTPSMLEPRIYSIWF